MLKGFVLYTEEEVNRLIHDVNEVILLASYGRFNAETNPRESCKEIHLKMKDLKAHIEKGYDTFANNSQMYRPYNDSHFI